MLCIIYIATNDFVIYIAQVYILWSGLYTIEYLFILLVHSHQILSSNTHSHHSCIVIYYLPTVL